MVSFDLGTAAVVSELVVTPVLFYASYWALRIWRASVVPLYRNQALAVFLIAFSSGLETLGFVFTGGIGNQISKSSAVLAFLFTFYWIDLSMLAIRRSDPLQRNPLRWNLLRLVLWTANIIGGLGGFATQLGLLNPLWWTYFLPVSPFVTYGIGGVSLLISARTSKDLALKTHLKWFGFYALFLGLFLIGPITASLGAIQSEGPLVYVVGGYTTVTYLIAGYSLYRSATSLVPFRRLPEGTYVH